MSVATQPQLPSGMRSETTRIVLRNIDWSTYTALRDNPANWPVRMTYDQGVLELMSPSRVHEWFAEFTGRLAVEWSMELGLNLCSCGSVTLRREDLDKGCEPDKSFYIEHEALMRPHDELDLTVHPPPDLVIEADVTADSSGRMPIYRAIQVPEVWRHDTERLRFYVLGGQGDYVEIDESRQLPLLRPEYIERFLELRKEIGENDAVKAFREWIRATILPQLEKGGA